MIVKSLLCNSNCHLEKIILSTLPWEAHKDVMRIMWYQYNSAMIIGGLSFFIQNNVHLKQVRTET